MKIHKEGYPTIFIVFMFLLLLLSGLKFAGVPEWLWYAFWGLSLAFFLFIVSFFRSPKRVVEAAANQLIAPADGTVVIIGEVEEPEYFNDKRLQISIFMSPLNVHVNWIPFSGLVKYFKYHPGKYLYARLPKASTDNERTTLVVEADNGRDYMVRQIAGLLARRIVHYKKKGELVTRGEEFGFIKFGSRVDVFLPLGSKVLVELNQRVSGKETILAEW